MRNTSLMRRWIDRAIGMLFIGIGIRLAFAQRE
jgi:threonine/homoserine/homoserine lactone efflux protein